MSESSAMIRRWADDDPHRPQGCCYDCREPYGTFPDLIVPDEWWLLITPRLAPDGEPGFGGLLCPTCMHRRFVALEVDPAEVPSLIASGPMMQPDSLMHGQTVGERLVDGHSDTNGGRATEVMATRLVAGDAGAERERG